MQNFRSIDHIYYTCPRWKRSCSDKCLYVLNVVSQLSQGGDVLRDMLSYGVQGNFVYKIFMALITFIKADCNREAYVVLDGIWS